MDAARHTLPDPSKSARKNMVLVDTEGVYSLIPAGVETQPTWAQPKTPPEVVQAGMKDEYEFAVAAGNVK